MIEDTSTFGPLFFWLWICGLVLGLVLGWVLGHMGFVSPEEREFRDSLELTLSRQFYRLYQRDELFVKDFTEIARQFGLIPLKLNGNCALFLKREGLVVGVLTLVLVPPVGAISLGQSLAGEGGPFVRACLRPVSKWEAELSETLGKTYRDDPLWEDDN